ncbi:MAG: GGDEF domain-containing protein [Deltaproteobacteria bacterium]
MTLKSRQIPISRQEFENLSLFHKVSYESVAGYLLETEVLELDPDAVLISPMKWNQNLYVVLSGNLEVRVEAPDGLLVGSLQQGDCAGEMSVFDNCDPSAWVVSRDQSRVLPISRQTALAMLHASHDFSLNLLHILSQRVRFTTRVMTADKHHIRRIEEYATVDALTGLHNRRWMQTMFDREVQRSRIGKLPLGALMLDIDHFKNVNDKYGHLAGDVVLAAVAQVTSMSLRPSDMIVRYGGEEIVILLPNTQPKDSWMVSERIRTAVESHEIDLSEEGLLRVTVSIGVSNLAEGDTVESLIARADKALYAAKNSGRNCSRQQENDPANSLQSGIK